MLNNGGLALDTNVIVDFLKNTRGAIDLAALIDEHDCFVSVITKLELLKYPEITAQEEARIEDFLALVPILPMNAEIENKTIAISRATKLKLPDAGQFGSAELPRSFGISQNSIPFLHGVSSSTKLQRNSALRNCAATAIVNKASLVTRDKHFIECVYPPLHLWP